MAIGILSTVLCCNMYAQEKTDTIATVNVYGKQKERDMRSTAPMFSLTHEALDLLGITDIANALHRLPGITLRDYGGAGGMKTVSVRGFGAQHTGVVYDGVALSDCQSGQIDVSRYSLDNAATLSLTIGDNDDIFVPVRNATSAASLHITTLRKPSFDLAPHIMAQMRTGGWGYANPFLRIDKNASDRLSVNIMGEYIHADNNYPFTIMNVNTPVHYRRQNNRMDSWHTEANVQWQPWAGHYITAKVYYYDNDRQLPGQAHYYVNNNEETLHDQNCFGQLNYRVLSSERLQVAWTGKFNYTMTDYKDPSYVGNIKDHQYWQREAYTSLCLLYRPHRHWALDYSADYIFNNLKGSDVSDYSDPLRHSILQSLTAKYSTGRLTVMGRLIASLFYNDATAGRKAKDMKHLSPSLSLNYKPMAAEELYLRLSYKDIFRAPSFNESYYYHYGSTDLNAEKTDQINLGMAWIKSLTEGTELSVTIDTYCNHVRDKIVAVPQTMFIWKNINLGKVRSLGLDFTGSISQVLGKGNVLTLSGNYTLQSITNRTNKANADYGLQLAYTPVHSGSGTLSWQNPWVNVSMNGVFASCRWANCEHYEGTMLRSYEDFGITAYRTIGWGKHQLSLRMDVKNVFNKQYEIVRLYPMPGRQWMLTVKYILN